MELSATGKVISGMLAARPRSGYEIKQLVDNSARFFWAASYGQIYPELKKLEKAGLITGDDSSTGRSPAHDLQAHRRGPARGARVDRQSLPEVLEMRDEGLLKLFFAGSIDPKRAAEVARERAADLPYEVGRAARDREQVERTGSPRGPTRSRMPAR